MDNDDIATIAASNEVADNLKILSLRSLNVNSPYSDNTTGTAIRWLGH